MARKRMWGGVGRGAWGVGVALTFGVAQGLSAQAGPDGTETLDLFFDCQGSGCYDLDFFRRQIPWINWVRDRESADVHVLVTSQTTGGGGLETTLTFIGRERFEGEDQTLVVHTAGDATQDEIRRAEAARLKLGLGRYLAATGMADRLELTAPGNGGGPGGPGGRPQRAAPGDDPWNFWVFTVDANGFINGQSSATYSNYYGTLRANRTTPAWKVSLQGNYSENRSRIELSDGTLRETKKDWGFNASVVKSLGPRWSVGIGGRGGSSTFYNQDFRGALRPGVEYNFFPYAESSRRSLTVQYLVGPQYSNYKEETIYEVLSETRLQQTLTGRLSLNQPWGDWTTTLTVASYVPETAKYHVTLSGNFNIRLFKGFSLRAFGSYTKVRDQLDISAEGATDEQILLQLRQLSTTYRFFTSFGIRYRFGSIFNNVVNTRFGPNYES